MPFTKGKPALGLGAGVAGAVGPVREKRVTGAPDPFRHHTGLRAKIKPWDTSYFRTITSAGVRAALAARNVPLTFPFHPDPVREALRAEALAGHAGRPAGVCLRLADLGPGTRFRRGAARPCAPSRAALHPSSTHMARAAPPRRRG